MIKQCVGYEIRHYKRKKDGSDATMGILYCLKDDERIVGKGVEEILVFTPDLYNNFNQNLVNSNIEIEYRINGSSAFVSGLKIIK